MNTGTWHSHTQVLEEPGVPLPALVRLGTSGDFSFSPYSARAMVALLALFARLSSLPPHIHAALQYGHLGNFFATVSRLSPLIWLEAPRRTAGTPPLPRPVQVALSHVLELPIVDVDSIWNALGDLALHSAPAELLPQQDDLDRRLSAVSRMETVG